MLNNIITLSNFPFFTEFFLITNGILLTIVFTVIKTKSIFKYQIQKPLSKCISLIFVMSGYLIVNEFLFVSAYYQINSNFSYATISGDSLGLFIKLLICIFASMFFYIIVDFLEDQNLESSFLLILYFATVGLILLCVCNDLISSYLSIELISLSSYLLSSFKKESNYSIEAGLKYFVIGSISSAFFLLGSSFIYASSGTVFFIELHHLFDSPAKLKLENLRKNYIQLSEKISKDIDQAEALYLMFTDQGHECIRQFSELELKEPSRITLCEKEEALGKALLADYNANLQLAIRSHKLARSIDIGSTGKCKESGLFVPVSGLPFFSPDAYFFTYFPHLKNVSLFDLTVQQHSNLKALEKLLDNNAWAKSSTKVLISRIDYMNAIIAAQTKIVQLEDIRSLRDSFFQSGKNFYDYGNRLKEELSEILIKINQINNALLALEKSPSKLIELGVAFLLFSIFIKLALAPFHLWSLDVYEGSPTISTFFFAVMTKLSLFMFLIRFCYSAMPAFLTEWQFYSVWIAIVSLFVGSFGGLKQRKLKTLIAYSSINHMGYALLAFSMGSFFSLKLLILYLIIYMLSGICIWFSILLLRLKQRKKKYSKELSDLSLLVKTNPALAISLAITFFSIAGLPPFLGFIAKIGVFLSLLKEEFYFFCAIAVLCSVVSTFYYIRIIKTMFFENVLVGKLYYPITSKKVWLLSFCTFLLLFIFINPKLLFLLIHIIIELT